MIHTDKNGVQLIILFVEVINNQRQEKGKPGNVVKFTSAVCRKSDSKSFLYAAVVDGKRNHTRPVPRVESAHDPTTQTAIG